MSPRERNKSPGSGSLASNVSETGRRISSPSGEKSGASDPKKMKKEEVSYFSFSQLFEVEEF